MVNHYLVLFHNYFWPRPWPQPPEIGLGLEVLASFNITGYLLCCVVVECIQRSCSDLRCGEHLTTTNSRCERNLVLLRSPAAVSSSPSRCFTAIPAAVVEILPSRSRSTARPPSGQPGPRPDQAGPPWTDSVVRRTKDASPVSRRTHSFPVDADAPPPSTTTTTTGSERLNRKHLRRRSVASSPTSQPQSSSTANSAAGDNVYPQTSPDYDGDVIDDRLTSEVTTSSPPTVNTAEQQ